ncbi:hypothetical protein ILYODFUR_028562 [Ilyodon furcidens]|uniref:Uncharacterized protein n=1 Tax=Ilyodon furcidens TaxID=33524 RepID=A0ABV0V6X2_9TELE
MRIYFAPTAWLERMDIHHMAFNISRDNKQPCKSSNIQTASASKCSFVYCIQNKWLRPRCHSQMALPLRREENTRAHTHTHTHTHAHTYAPKNCRASESW